jgi:hypothetical protein
MSKIFSEEALAGIKENLVGDRTSFLKQLSEAETNEEVIEAFFQLHMVCRKAIIIFGGDL